MSTKTTKKRRKNKGKETQEIELESLNGNEDEGSAPRQPRSSPNITGLSTKATTDESDVPPGRKRHVWNSITINLLAFMVGYICLSISESMHYWFQTQTDFYADSWDTEKTFQHIPELKLLYTGDWTYKDNSSTFPSLTIPKDSNMVGLSPGYYVAWILIIGGIIGIVEYVLGRIRQPFVFIAQALSIAGWCVILLTPLVIVNNASAMIHRKYVNVSWWGYGWDRYRTGYCHMNETDPNARYENGTKIDRKISMLDAQYILPVAIHRSHNETFCNDDMFCSDVTSCKEIFVDDGREDGLWNLQNCTGTTRNETKTIKVSPNLRKCQWITDLHGLQILFSLYCCIVASMHIQVAKYPAWGMGRCVDRKKLKDFYSERILR